MKKLSIKTKENWIILLAISFYVFFIIFSFFSDEQEILNSGRSQNKIPFFLLFFTGILIAPIVEEFLFRGLFIKHKIKKIIALLFPVVLFFYMSTNFSNFSKLLFLLLGVVSSAILIAEKEKTRVGFYYLVIISSFLFSIVHYKQEDFKSLSALSMMISQFSFALASVWITLNFGLFKSIVFHFFHNLILLFIALYGYQMVDVTQKKYENESLVLVWKKNKILDEEAGLVKREKTKLIIKNTNLETASNYAQLNDSIKDKMIYVDYFQNYTLTIQSKTDHLSDSEILECLNKISTEE
jgi:membrane protease YdiL (CAAX protease family)